MRDIKAKALAFRLVAGAIVAVTTASLHASASSAAQPSSAIDPPLPQGVEFGHKAQDEPGFSPQITTPPCVLAADGVETCVTIESSDPASLSQLKRPGRSPSGGSDIEANLPTPPQCRDAAPVENQMTNVNISRTESCSAWFNVLRVRQTVNNVTTVVGQLNFWMRIYNYSDARGTSWNSQVKIVPTFVDGKAKGTVVTGEVGCNLAAGSPGGACGAESAGFATKTISATENVALGESTWRYAGSSTPSTGGTTWSVRLSPPGLAGGSISNAFGTVRCDNSVGGLTAGCINPKYIPSLTYSRAAFPEFARHVEGAQNSGLPGGSASDPLRRLTDSVAMQRNNTVACGPSYVPSPRPTGKQCDEYPFRSTYEGAALSGGGPRTQSWCGITLPQQPSTGPYGYSICLINGSQNMQAGSTMLNSLYKQDRVLDGDKFFISFKP
ncbi:hypothetical protein FHR80_004499 [Cellulomonas cellasea]|uniref:Deoxyribonuclease NucA/NucB domain-containing protein n=1 Tax=Cellulomonas cellasea TaxID=43670 RepID=A0A7W4YED7_9CELL|nr:hypothetical protein [Cellulomonas cellasea]